VRAIFFARVKYPLGRPLWQSCMTLNTYSRASSGSGAAAISRASALSSSVTQTRMVTKAVSASCAPELLEMPQSPFSCLCALHGPGACGEGAETILAGAAIQDPHQSGSAGGGVAPYRLARLLPHRERLGQRGGVGSRRGKNPLASRECRHDLKCTWRTWARCKTPDSGALDHLREATNGRNDRRRKSTGPRAAELGTTRDLYLTRVDFLETAQAVEKVGSSGRTRTYNPPVNSRMLCH
jgi:hypothetical protein